MGGTFSNPRFVRKANSAELTSFVSASTVRITVFLLTWPSGACPMRK